MGVVRQAGGATIASVALQSSRRVVIRLLLLGAERVRPDPAGRRSLNCAKRRLPPSRGRPLAHASVWEGGD
jgi:hypothetical protein